jgi:hypothetical protein
MGTELRDAERAAAQSVVAHWRAALINVRLRVATLLGQRS